jgi:ATP-dependent DNA ligase
MTLPLQMPFPPMEALSVETIPEGEKWQYEPKWDGFRCVVFRDGDSIELQSKAGQPLTRYFPEVVEAVSTIKAKQFVLDGELVVPAGRAFSFDDLLLRIHPAASRVAKLAAESPATLIVFDLLVDDKAKSLVALPLKERRPRLESFAKKYFAGRDDIRLSPATDSVAEVKKWFRTAGGGLDGVIAKRLDLAYRSGERTGMQKIKTMRTADCVVGGFRYASKKKVIGSLLLGLYDARGKLNHVGFCSGLKDAQRTELTPQLEKLVKPPGFTGRAPGGPSRWSTERSEHWEPLQPVLVVEVQYDHFSGGRFRHGTRFMRWRPDKAPEQCTLDQLGRGRGSSFQLLESDE